MVCLVEMTLGMDALKIVILMSSPQRYRPFMIDLVPVGNGLMTNRANAVLALEKFARINVFDVALRVIKKSPSMSMSKSGR
jgi:hypothetical protein